MTRTTSVRAAMLAGATVIGLACAEQPMTAPDDTASFAKGAGGGGVSVQSTVPSRTEPGTTLDVRVIGSGFDAGTRVAFALGGIATPNIVTNHTTFVASNELVANITVAGDAEVASYDVIATTTGGKKGIGTELFLVSYSVTDLGGHPTLIYTVATDVNASGVIIGNAGRGTSGNPGHVMRWTLSGIGQATAEDLHPFLEPAFRSVSFQINDAGAIVGYRQVTVEASSSRPFLLAADGSRTDLNTVCGAAESSRQGHAIAISETGAVVGTQVDAAGIMPIYWAPGALCAEPLPHSGVGGEPHDISADGMTVVGYSWDAAGVYTALRWTRRVDGTGWDPAALPVESNSTRPVAIGADGTIVGMDQRATLVRRRGSSYYDYSQNAYRWPSGSFFERLQGRGGDATWAADIDGAQIAGSSNDRIDGPLHAVVWQADGSLVDLGAIMVGGHSMAAAISGNLVVGRADVDTPGRGIETHAVVWTIP